VIFGGRGGNEERGGLIVVVGCSLMYVGRKMGKEGSLAYGVYFGFDFLEFWLWPIGKMISMLYIFGESEFKCRARMN